jgi:PilZ domain
MLTKTTIARRIQAFIEERRKEPRFFADEEVILVTNDETHVARVTDRSSRGLGVMHTCRLRLGDEIQILTPSDTLTAQVVWSKDDDGTYRSGLQIFERPSDTTHSS